MKNIWKYIPVHAFAHCMYRGIWKHEPEMANGDETVLFNGQIFIHMF